ncbi:unnamed protein product [Schistosoma turkestanicum]|nr:unnamed protein product [Schistosoma turkestanicum]
MAIHIPDRLSLEKHLDTNSPTNNNPLQSGVTSSVERQSSSINVSSINTNKIIDLFVCSTEKSHRYQPVGANPNLLLTSRIIPHGPNPLLVHGPNPSLVHGSIYQ